MDLDHKAEQRKRIINYNRKYTTTTKTFFFFFEMIVSSHKKCFHFIAPWERTVLSTLPYLPRLHWKAGVRKRVSGCWVE